LFSAIDANDVDEKDADDDLPVVIPLVLVGIVIVASNSISFLSSEGR